MANTDTLEIRQLARQFAESELRPHTEKWDHERALDPNTMAQLAELGFLGMLIPEAFGGMEFDLPAYVSALEEIAWGEPAAAMAVAINSVVSNLIVNHGSQNQKVRWLEKMALGEITGCVALAESDAGSDLSGLQTRAVKSGDGWTITGEKKWVTNGGSAQLALVAARVDNGVRVFVVPTDAPGYAVTQREATMGFRALDIVTVTLTDVPVDGDSELALEVVDELQLSRAGVLGMAAIALGISQAAFEHSVGYADVREQFREKLRNFEGIQFKLSDMAIRTEAARTLLQKAAEEATPALAAMAKVFASETAMWVTTQAVQIYGGYGYMRDYPVEKLMRDAKATEMLEGNNDVQRVSIARELYA